MILTNAVGNSVSAQVGAAVDYAQRGWPVFPCHAPVSGACSCGAREGCASPAKHPRTRRSLHDATADEGVVARWWTAWPANVGIRTGAGLGVLDGDPAHGGAAALADLEAFSQFRRAFSRQSGRLFEARTNSRG